MGDKEFKKFMDENEGSSENSQNNNIPFYLVLCAREKAKTIIELYNSSLNFYLKMLKETEISTKGSEMPKLFNRPYAISAEDIMKSTGDYIKKLSEESLNNLRQFDMIMIDAEPYDDDEIGGEPEDENAPI